MSNTEQARPQVPGGIWNCRVGGAAGRGGRKGPGSPANAEPSPKGNWADTVSFVMYSGGIASVAMAMVE